MEITKRFRIFVTMTSQEYTQWLKGFLDAVDGYNITKKQFDTIREKLKEVNDNVGTPISNGWGIHNWGGNIITPATPYSVPLTGTISSNTFTLTSGSSAYFTNTGVTTTGVSVFDTELEQEDSEMLLLD